MKTSKRVRPLFFILSCITFGSTAVIANIKEERASNIIMLWPKDGVSQDKTGMGTRSHTSFVLAYSILGPEHNDITCPLLFDIRNDCSAPKSDAG